MNKKAQIELMFAVRRVGQTVVTKTLQRKGQGNTMEKQIEFGWTMQNSRALEDVKIEFGLSQEQLMALVMRGTLRLRRVAKALRVPTVDLQKYVINNKA